MRQTQRLMSPWVAVVGLQSFDSIQPQLSRTARVPFNTVWAGDQIPLGGIVGCEADRVSVGLGAWDSETARDEKSWPWRTAPIRTD